LIVEHIALTDLTETRMNPQPPCNITRRAPTTSPLCACAARRVGLRAAARCLILCIATLWALTGCDGGKKGPPEKGADGHSAASADPDATAAPDRVVVEVVAVALGDVSETIFATGTLMSQKQLTLLAEAAGVVSMFSPQEGDLIEQPNAVIGKLHNPDLDLSVRTTQNQIRRLEAEVARLKPLLDKGYIPRGEHDRAATELDIARDELARARAATAGLTLRAPMRGVVSARLVEVGAQVSPGQPLLTLVDAEALEARLQIPEYELKNLRLGQPATLTSDALGPPAFPAEVTALSPVIDPASGTLRVTLRPTAITRDADGARLRPGMFIQAHITTQARAAVPLIPRRALLFDDAQPYVFAVQDPTTADPVARRTTIRTGSSSGDLIEVTHGLRPSDLVVILGQAALRDGAHVKVNAAPNPPPALEVPHSTSETTDTSPDATSAPKIPDTSATMDTQNAQSGAHNAKPDASNTPIDASKTYDAATTPETHPSPDTPDTPLSPTSADATSAPDTQPSTPK
jgi:membrane fusion protein (multidrug efflux system)